MRKIFVLLLLFQFGFQPAWSVDFQHDYSRTWVSKMFLSMPDKAGGSDVKITFEEAFDLIKQTDQLTLGVPKIIYLVGWQYNGHDDKYPAFFEVNPALKRNADPTALESLRWLIREARRYNTVVSLHINMTDAYEDSPLWLEYVEKDLISKNKNGELKVIGEYNGRKAYQINYRNEWNAGYTQMRIDRLVGMIPELKESATIHSDAWFARPSEGHNETMVMEAGYQQKTALYWKAKGVDVTNEFYLDYLQGYVPFIYHFNAFSQQDYMNIPADVCTGSGLNPDIRETDFDLGFLFGTTCYGETCWMNKPIWAERLTSAFMLNCPHYFFLNRHKRLNIEGTGKDRVVLYDGNIKVSLSDSTVTHGNRVLRRGNTCCYPAVWRTDGGAIVYSADKDGKMCFDIPYLWDGAKQAVLYKITTSGLQKIKNLSIQNFKFTVDIEKGVPYYVIPE